MHQSIGGCYSACDMSHLPHSLFPSISPLLSSPLLFVIMAGSISPAVVRVTGRREEVIEGGESEGGDISSLAQSGLNASFSLIPLSSHEHTQAHKHTRHTRAFDYLQFFLLEKKFNSLSDLRCWSYIQINSLLHLSNEPHLCLLCLLAYFTQSSCHLYWELPKPHPHLQPLHTFHLSKALLSPSLLNNLRQRLK